MLAYILVTVVVMSAACAEKSAGESPDAGEVPTDFGQTKLDLDVSSDAADAASSTCTALFGDPNERTGLRSEQCGTSCSCPNEIELVNFDAPALANLLAWDLATPFEGLVEDPYATGHELVPSKVCVALFDTSTGSYSLETQDAGEVADGVVTHGGECGLCSTLQDLEAYVRNGDLTEPVRQCGLDGIRDGQEANVACLEALGFTRPCAEIWYFNTLNTRMACLEPCFAALNEPYHLPDGSLNECLACDERESGVTFKSVAGRTRRNSGLASAICRPCNSVTRVTHAYPQH